MNGSKIKTLMDERGISFRELSDMTGISKSTLQRHAAGLTKNIPIEAMEKIASALGTTVADLLGFSAESFVEDLKREIAELEAELETCTDPERREEIEDTLGIKVESLDDIEFAMSMSSVRPAAPARDLTPAQSELLGLASQLPDEDLAVLIAAAQAQLSSRKSRDGQ